MKRIAPVLTIAALSLPLVAQNQPPRVEFMEFKPAQKPCCHPYEAAHPTP